MGNKQRDMLKDLIAIEERMNRLFDDLRLQQTGRLSGGAWCPSADVYEVEEAIVVEVEVPEVSPEEIEISIQDNVLTVRGQRRFSRNRDQEHYYCLERTFGAFSRVFSLPVVPEEEGVNARCDNGVLTITIPKKSAPDHKIRVG